jgi:hypothetical protein
MKTIALVLFICLLSASAFAAKQYSYFRVGNPTDVTTATTAGTVLMAVEPTLMPPFSGCASVAAMEISW